MQSPLSPGAGSLPPWSRRGAETFPSLTDRQTPPPNPTPRHHPRAASLTAKDGRRQQSSTSPATPEPRLIGMTRRADSLPWAATPSPHPPWGRDTALRAAATSVLGRSAAAAAAAAQTQLPPPAPMPSRGCDGAIHVLTSWMDSRVRSQGQHEDGW